MGAWHEQRLRVRFEETDMMGVVYYGKYFVWFEVGRVNLLRDLGITLKDWDLRGYHIPVVQAHADYKAPAHFDEEILIKTRVGSVGNSSVKFENEVYRMPEMKLLCTGHSVHALVGEGMKSAPFPDDIRGVLTSS